MKLFCGIVLVMMVFVSACAQQPVAEPEAQPTVQPTEPEPVVEPETEVAVAEEAPEVTSDEVRILKSSVEPMELTITSGSSVTFMNDGGITSVIVIKKDGANYKTTPLVDAGEKFEFEFAEPGEYTYWAVSYGPQGAKITVE